jgi:uncharacterized protein (TIGR00725 family)
VIGDGSADPPLLALAESVGAALARLGITVVTGGRGGIMDAASRGAVNAGGTALGIVPSTDPDEASPWCSIVVPTGMGHARNALTALAGDFVVVIGGGAGTLSETALAWIHGRPILVCAGSGGWADLAADHPPDRRGSSTITRCADLPALEHAIRVLCAARGLPLTGASPGQAPH